MIRSEMFFALGALALILLAGCSGSDSSGAPSSSVSGPMSFAQQTLCDDSNSIQAMLIQFQLNEVTAQQFAQAMDAKATGTWIETQGVSSASLHYVRDQGTYSQDYSYQVSAHTVSGGDVQNSPVSVNCATSAIVPDNSETSGSATTVYLEIGDQVVLSPFSETTGRAAQFIFPAQLALGHEGSLVVSTLPSNPNSPIPNVLKLLQNPDQFAQSVADAVRSAAARGVTVQLRFFRSQNGSVVAVEMGTLDSQSPTGSTLLSSSHSLIIIQSDL